MLGTESICTFMARRFGVVGVVLVGTGSPPPSTISGSVILVVDGFFWANPRDRVRAVLERCSATRSKAAADAADMLLESECSDWDVKNGVVVEVGGGIAPAVVVVRAAGAGIDKGVPVREADKFIRVRRERPR